MKLKQYKDTRLPLNNQMDHVVQAENWKNLTTAAGVDVGEMMLIKVEEALSTLSEVLFLEC